MASQSTISITEPCSRSHQSKTSLLEPIFNTCARLSTSIRMSSKKMHLRSGAFRGFGCISASDVTAPESLVRSSANWKGKRSCKKNQRHGRKKENPLHSSNFLAVSDACSSPDTLFKLDTVSVDCSPNTSDTVESIPIRAARRSRENRSSRRIFNDLQHEYSLHSSPTLSSQSSRADISHAQQCHRLCGFHLSPSVLHDVMVLKSSFVLGEAHEYDQYGDLRLDIDSMSYEELLELGDKIGYVSTGLTEDTIVDCLMKMKSPVFDDFPSVLSAEVGCKCSICQEEFRTTVGVGRLECGHAFHVNCIRQWLLQKNVCPVCKVAVAKW